MYIVALMIVLMLQENVSSNESEGEEGSVTEKKDKVYVPPKLSAVHYCNRL